MPTFLGKGRTAKLKSRVMPLQTDVPQHYDWSCSVEWRLTQLEQQIAALHMTVSQLTAPPTPPFQPPPNEQPAPGQGTDLSSPPPVDYDMAFLDSKLGLLKKWVKAQSLSLLYDSEDSPFIHQALLAKIANKRAATFVIFTTDNDVFGFYAPLCPQRSGSEKMMSGGMVFSLYNNGRTKKPVMQSLGDTNCYLAVNSRPQQRQGMVSFRTVFSSVEIQLNMFYPDKTIDSVSCMTDSLAQKGLLTYICVGKALHEKEPAMFFIRRLVVFNSEKVSGVSLEPGLIQIKINYGPSSKF